MNSDNSANAKYYRVSYQLGCLNDRNDLIPQEIKSEEYKRVKAIVDEVKKPNVMLDGFPDDDTNDDIPVIILNNIEDLFNVEHEVYKKEARLLRVVFNLFKLEQTREGEEMLDVYGLKYRCYTIYCLANRICN